MKKIGIVGLGNMGYPMADNYLADYKQLNIFDLNEDKLNALAQKGATVCSNLKELSANSDVIFLSLPGPVQVESVITGVDGLLSGCHEGQMIVDYSTVAPLTNKRMIEACAAKGVTYVDAPVSGGPAGIVNRKLSIMVGATEEECQALDLIRYFESIGNTFHYVGVKGGGSAIKIINNYMAFAAQAINGEAMKMADALGLSEDIFYQVTTTSSGNNMILGAKKAKILNKDFKPGFALDLVMKDLELARQLCQDEKISNYMLNTAIQLYRDAQSKGYGSLDSSSVIQSIRQKEID